MRISVDIDGVLADFNSGFATVVNEVYPNTIPDGWQANDWDWSQYMNEEMRSKVWDVLREKHNFWMGLKPHKTNVGVLRDFLSSGDSNGVEVFFVTSRIPTGGYTVLEQTNKWLNSHFFLSQGWSVIPVVARKKQDVFQTLGIEFSIDDYDNNVRRAKDLAGHQAYLLDRSYNKAATDLDAVRLTSLGQYLDIVVKTLQPEPVASSS